MAAPGFICPHPGIQREEERTICHGSLASIMGDGSHASGESLNREERVVARQRQCLTSAYSCSYPACLTVYFVLMFQLTLCNLKSCRATNMLIHFPEESSAWFSSALHPQLKAPGLLDRDYFTKSVALHLSIMKPLDLIAKLITITHSI